MKLFIPVCAKFFSVFAQFGERRSPRFPKQHECRMGLQQHPRLGPPIFAGIQQMNGKIVIRGKVNKSAEKKEEENNKCLFVFKNENVNLLACLCVYL